MENSPLPLFIDTPSEWLENIFDRASIFLAMQCRENLFIVCLELWRGYMHLKATKDPIAWDFLQLWDVVNKALLGVLAEA